MSKVLRGKVWRFEGILDVDWEICPLEELRAQAFQLRSASEEERLKALGRHCMVKVDPDFPDKVQPGDFVVGGEGTGYGHDHDHACMSLKGAGVGAVLCEATNTNFKRNSIHHGLPVIEVKGIMSETKTGDELEVDLVKGKVQNLTTGKTLTFLHYPDFILGILEAGGLYNQLASQIKSGEYT
ncbi:MAG: 3-isopropylmalate dehydratase [Desulfobacteraceae bacterium]|nr:3-isopropylmalate dehydratase [Desulfobacteraceae bacterium]